MSSSLRARAPRNSLSRQLVIDGAMFLADTEGLASLTIRSLADHLGAKPMALYNHVANKEALLDALVEQVFAEITRPDPAGHWRYQLALRARSARTVLVRHPWSIGLLETRTSGDLPATLGHHEAVMATLRAAGCSPALTGRCYLLLDSYVYGFALQEVTMPSTDPHSSEAGELIAALDADAYPSMSAVMAAHANDAAYSFDAEFEAGLELVLDGIDRWLTEERRRAW